jgi:hypothetical protein
LCTISSSVLLLLLLLPPATNCRYINNADSSRFRLIKGKQFKLSLADDAASLPDEFKVTAYVTCNMLPGMLVTETISPAQQ